MPDEPMTWDDDLLEYGYVLDRIPGGGWWHLHFGRAGWTYHCDLLGRRTDILGAVQRFARGAVPDSPRFLLSLDGEGVELPEAEAVLDFRWGDRPANPVLAADAEHFQREVMPLLDDSPAFQWAAAEVVARQRHRRVVALNKLSRADKAKRGRESN